MKKTEKIALVCALSVFASSGMAFEPPPEGSSLNKACLLYTSPSPRD